MSTKSIPGPKKRPVLGSIRPFATDPPRFLTDLMQEYGGMVQFHLFNRTVYLVSEPDYIREVLVTKHKLFPRSELNLKVMGRFLGRGLLSSEGDYHRQQRRLAQPAFHAKRIAGYADTMVNYTARHIEAWQEGDIRDISEEMMTLTMFIVSKTLFDADMDTMRDRAEAVGRAIEKLQEITNRDFKRPFLFPTWLPTADNRQRRQQRKVIYDVIEQIIQERRSTAVNGRIQDSGDLLSMLLLAEDEAGHSMSDQQVRDEAVTLFAAGHETTANTLTWTWYLLAQHPEVAAKLEAEIEQVLGLGANGRLPTLADLPHLPYAEMIVKEAMRLYPPAWALGSRQASEATTIGDYTIPQGGLIFIAPYVVHRQPQYFPDPEQFDPERFHPEREKTVPRYAYIPFGGGPHVCIGNSFAMMEAHLLLVTIAQRFRLALRQEVVELNPLVTLSPKEGLHMALQEQPTRRPAPQQEAHLPLAVH